MKRAALRGGTSGSRNGRAPFARGPTGPGAFGLSESPRRRAERAFIVCQLFLAFRQISDPKSERAFGQCSAIVRLEPIAAGREGGKALDKGL